ncbi:hypothetical protein RB195_006233 [Necator americanus]|uniref:Uncharacterized protein n=1 Tax=Necator americanus TaxID=51031 RepID=A0ABR1BRM5_NECAM
MFRRLKPRIGSVTGTSKFSLKTTHPDSVLKWPLVKNQHVNGRELSRFSDQLLELQSYWKPIHDLRNGRNTSQGHPDDARMISAGHLSTLLRIMSLMAKLKRKVPATALCLTPVTTSNGVLHPAGVGTSTFVR